MKKYIFIIMTIMIGMNLQSFAQKLEENKTDNFTNKSIKRTSWETLCSSLGVNAHFRFSLVDTYETFDLKLMLDEVFSIDKDQEIMFKLDNGEIVKLQNLQYTITCTGCGATGNYGSQAEGISVLYLLNKDQIAQLKTHKVVQVRITTNAGHFDNDVKDKAAGKIMASLNLL